MFGLMLDLAGNVESIESQYINISLYGGHYLDLLILSDNDKSHYLDIKDLDRSMFHKTKHKNKKWFCRSFL